ncbi:hypothetical protein [Streptacidiphilus rugosus]|uniref:hypothetical protein n=1 Tax=Streptacidiphilus rugosus TaxID=405783 RepID=UPI0012FC5C44|nr:hypothetical protein [Streptacidiphilus rugosus]
MPGPAAPSPLPTRQQLAELRNFVLERARTTAAIALQLNGEPPHPDPTALADARHAGRALYMVVNMLSRRVLDAVHSGQPSEAARDAWGSLLVVADEWRDSPEMPEGLGALVATCFGR